MAWAMVCGAPLTKMGTVGGVGFTEEGPHFLVTSSTPEGWV